MDNDNAPREKLITKGAPTLSDKELLAIILRSGGNEKPVKLLAQEIIDVAGGLKGLINLKLEQINKIKHMGTAKTTSIIALVEIAKRITLQTHSKARGTNPKQVYEYIRSDLFGLEHETLYVLSLNSRNYITSKTLVTIGTVNETIVHPREVYKIALAKNAVGIILVHNHPSESPEPSKEDILTTHRILKAGILLGIPLVDHLIATDHDFFSLRASNLLVLEKGGE